jgi:hypothetical protein
MLFRPICNLIYVRSQDYYNVRERISWRKTSLRCFESERQFGDIGVCGRVTSKLVFKIYGLKDCNGLNWLRLESRGTLLWKW